MTLLRPGMKGYFKLPDGSVFQVEVAKDGLRDLEDDDDPSLDGDDKDQGPNNTGGYA